MRAKVKKNKHTGETLVEYLSAAEKASGRFETLEKLLRGHSDITIFIDTNQRISDLSAEEAAGVLGLLGIRHKMFPTEANKRSFFGFSLNISLKNKQKQKEHIFILNISSEQFTRELFETLLMRYDIAVGIGRKKDFDEICESLHLDASEALFNREYFEESVYDSILCSCLRCSFDIEKYNVL